jgi:subtilisin
VAPQARLWAVRVLNNSGSGSWSSVICGVDWVDARSPARGGPIDVANMSLGGTGSDDGNCGSTNDDALHRAICRAVADGVTFAVAAGNESDDVRRHVPAAYDEVIAVTAVADSNGLPCGGGNATSYGADDTFASFSNRAALAADVAHTVAAPGVAIRSTWKAGKYKSISGTSMATPHVAGWAALFLATHPGASPAGVLNTMRSTGEPPNVNFGGDCTSGVSHTASSAHPEPVIRADTL